MESLEKYITRRPSYDFIVDESGNSHLQLEDESQIDLVHIRKEILLHKGNPFLKVDNYFIVSELGYEIIINTTETNNKGKKYDFNQDQYSIQYICQVTEIIYSHKNIEKIIVKPIYQSYPDSYYLEEITDNSRRITIIADTIDDDIRSKVKNLGELENKLGENGQPVHTFENNHYNNIRNFENRKKLPNSWKFDSLVSTTFYLPIAMLPEIIREDAYVRRRHALEAWSLANPEFTGNLNENEERYRIAANVRGIDPKKGGRRKRIKTRKNRKSKKNRKTRSKK